MTEIDFPLAGLDVPASHMTPTSLTYPIEYPLESWLRDYSGLHAFQSASQWWLGDHYLFGERKWPGEHSQILEARNESSLSVYRWVSERIPPADRRQGLSWTHHREVAALDKPERDRLLDLAEQAELTTAELKREVKGTTDRPRLDVKGIRAYSSTRVGSIWTAADHRALMDRIERKAPTEAGAIS